MLNKEILYTLNDVVVAPAPISEISSRSQCNPYVQNPMTDSNVRMLPLIASPMNNIINDDNYKAFLDAGINVVIPRDDERIDYEIRKARWESLWTKVFVALSLKEFKQYFESNPKLNETIYVCVDLANGHMRDLIWACRGAKLLYGDKLVIMTGNIANPKTYKDYAQAGIDYVRCGIGSGSICTTAANTSIHFPMASLIEKCKQYKNEVELDLEHAKYKEHGESIYKCAPKIVADGGFTNYDQIIKVLALGADYCMCGKLFAQCIEACTSIISDKDFILPEESDAFDVPIHSTIRKPYNNVEFVLQLMKEGHNFHRDYYGMSTKRAQREMGGKGNKTAEGIAIQIPVKQPVEGWANNFISYLRSAMSYTGYTKIEDFIGGPECYLQSTNSFGAYFK